ncbi:hypothetical protein COCMIDRAFT_27256 [Bipolaris oryzae ATCC 44560]|uniref:Nephrocystin 3-like N-terminal domain-containing protein n=1 Tax=Bipolaris oryzae ATCC 44560 TaxID=930090 RepID=W6Z3Q6_COCMI|nr:uncharacterized protein COCMIDRAFT_27256 [Bipolaris oryzae ATCC 44560]EUC44373.1 hypothetical protein COCMIDRAFT_27256 [Bipolaris oryzae ATCC 44560]
MSPSEIKMENVCKLRMKLLEVRKECEILMLQKLEDVASELRSIKLELQKTTFRLKAISSTAKSIEIASPDTNVRVQENQWRLRQDAESKARNKALSELKGQMQLKDVEEQSILDVASSVKRVLTAGFPQRRRKARVFCQPSHTITERSRRSFASIVKGLVYQLAEHHSTGLRLQHDLVREALSSTKWHREEPKTAFDHMLDLLSALMEHLPTKKPILMITDRLDQCRWSNESRRDCTELEDAVISLLHMMRNQTVQHPRLKILLVME